MTRAAGAVGGSGAAATRVMALLLALALVPALGVGVGGCGFSATGAGQGPLLIYLSVPLSGKEAGAGRTAASGARAALASAGGRAAGRQIELRVLDDTGGGPRWSLVATGADARTATEDASTIAYLGELDPEATPTSAPITNLAQVPQVTLGPIPAGLDKGNLVGLTTPRPGRPNENPGSLAMKLVLDAITRAGSNSTDRQAVLDQLRKLAIADAAGRLGGS